MLKKEQVVVFAEEEEKNIDGLPFMKIIESNLTGKKNSKFIESQIN
jgi:hypothetical protein